MRRTRAVSTSRDDQDICWPSTVRGRHGHAYHNGNHPNALPGASAAATQALVQGHLRPSSARLSPLTEPVKRGSAVAHRRVGESCFLAPRASALLCAVQRGDYDTLVMLLDSSNSAMLEKPACKDVSTEVGIAILGALLTEACGREYLDCIELLLQHTRRPTRNLKRRGYFPMHSAAGAGAIESIELLISAGFLATSRDDVSRTPLHCAAANGRVECTSFLSVVARSTITARIEGAGDMPLHLAVRSGHCTCAEVLLLHGGRELVYAMNDDHITPVDIARSLGNNACIRVLDMRDTDNRHRRNMGWGLRQSHRKNGAKIDVDRIMAVWERFFENAANACTGRCDIAGDDNGAANENLHRGAAWPGRRRFDESSAEGTATSELHSDNMCTSAATSSDDEGVCINQSPGVNGHPSSTTRRSAWEMQPIPDTAEPDECTSTFENGLQSWVTCWDRESKSFYYCNSITGYTAWSAPPSAAASFSPTTTKVWDPKHGAFFVADQVAYSRWLGQDMKNGGYTFATSPSTMSDTFVDTAVVVEPLKDVGEIRPDIRDERRSEECQSCSDAEPVHATKVYANASSPSREVVSREGSDSDKDDHDVFFAAVENQESEKLSVPEGVSFESGIGVPGGTDSFPYHHDLQTDEELGSAAGFLEARETTDVDDNFAIDSLEDRNAQDDHAIFGDRKRSTPVAGEDSRTHFYDDSHSAQFGNVDERGLRHSHGLEFFGALTLDNFDDSMATGQTPPFSDVVPPETMDKQLAAVKSGGCESPGERRFSEGGHPFAALPTWMLWYSNDPDSRPYYVNQDTSESSWSLPQPQLLVQSRGWMKAWSEEDQAFFYANEWTGRVAWKLPDLHEEGNRPD